MATVPKGEANLPPEVEAEPKKKPRISNLVMLLILVGIVLVEVIIAGFILPSPTKIKSEVVPIIEGDAQKSTKIPYQMPITSAIKPEERVEMDLGDINLMDKSNSENGLMISIHFYALVNKTDAEDFKKRYAENEHRIRSAIIVILRSAATKDINDPVLGVLRNKILVKVNEILGAPLVKDIIFSDIST